MDRASSLKLSYQHVWEPNKRSPTRYDEKFIYLSDVAGLFLEESLTSRVFRIRNYATQQVLYLPDAHEGTKTMSFVFNSSTGECKVACFYAKEQGDHFGREVGFKILSIGKDDQWRTLKLPNQNHKSLHRKYRCAASQYDGAAHLIEIIRDGQDFKLEVQSFDIWSECFTITTLPRGVFLDLKEVSVICWHQTVAVADIVGEALQVLVLEDFMEHNWNKIIVPLKFLMDVPVLKGEIRPKLALSDELWFHNAAENTKSTEKKYFSHKPSLVTLKGMKNEY